MNTRTQLISKLKNKQYRDTFVASYIDQGIPFQIRALREQREWSQEKLASEAGMKQEAISRLENPNNKSFTLKTLKQLAAGFDVGIIVRFVTISSIVEWVHNLPNTSLEVISYKDDPYFNEEIIEEIPENLLKESGQLLTGENIIFIDDLQQRKLKTIERTLDVKQPEPKTRLTEIARGVA